MKRTDQLQTWEEAFLSRYARSSRSSWKQVRDRGAKGDNGRSERPGQSSDEVRSGSEQKQRGSIFEDII